MSRALALVCLLVAGLVGVAGPAAADTACPQQQTGVPLPAGAPREPTIVRLGLDRAWNLSRGAGVTVAVIDSGVDARRQPKLVPALVPGYEYRTTQTPPGYARAAGVTGDCDGHGTGVTSIIAARPGNDDRVVGVAPEARVAMVRAVTPIGNATGQQLADMINTAASLGSVLNLSWATREDSPQLRSAIQAALRRNVVIVAAAPNEDDQAANWYPAAYPGVLAVAAVKPDGTPLQGKNRASWIGVSAPGDRITALAPISGYQAVSGTSFATALVSGTAALVRSRFPGMPAAEVVRRIVGTAAPLGVGRDQVGAGMLDPYRALTGELPAVSPSATPTPVGSVAVQPRPAPPRTLADQWGRILAWGGVLGLAAVLAYLARLAVLAAIRRRWRAGGGPLEESPYEQPLEPPNVRLL
jgi:type VII secretion-associated serine protease mycosin